MEQVSESVMRKLAKIKALKESAEKIGSEGEAMAAAALLNELLMKHKLEMTDIEWDLEVKDEPVEEYSVGGGITYKNGKWTYKEYPDVEIKRKRIEWSEDLARMIASTYGCRSLITSGMSRIWFVGRKSNVAIVEYMYITMYRVVENLSWKEYKTARNKVKWQQIKHLPKAEQSKAVVDYRELDGFRSAWIDGFVGRVSEMLYDVRMKNEAPSNSTALVRLNSDALATQKYMDEKFGDKKGLQSLTGRSRWNAAGAAAGRAKASEVGLTATGMGKAKDPKQLQ